MKLRSSTYSDIFFLSKILVRTIKNMLLDQNFMQTLFSVCSSKHFWMDRTSCVIFLFYEFSCFFSSKNLLFQHQFVVSEPQKNNKAKQPHAQTMDANYFF